MPPHVQIIARDNGAGLSRDLALLTEGLQAIGARVTPRPIRGHSRMRSLATYLRHLLTRPRFDVNIMLESIRPEFARCATHNVLIPNPEYFGPDGLSDIHHVDAVWCKTQHALSLFEVFGTPCTWIGFTSPDQFEHGVARRPTFLHSPGRSNNKGTRALIALWAANPTWPTLTVIWRRRRTTLGEVPANVRLLSHYIDDHTYRSIQNEHRFHICPSQTEGFGHYLVEAMSCAAVVVTLDAAPMNELIAPDRGILVAAKQLGRKDLATTWQFDAEAMKHAIERCLHMPEDEAVAIGQAARDWFLQTAPAFQASIARQLQQLTPFAS